MDQRSCPACGRPALAYWRQATASDPQLAGRARFVLERCAVCGSAATVGDAADHAAMYEGGTYAPAGGLARRLLAPLRGLAERDRMRFIRGLAPGARVLEVGAGDGKLVALMRASGLDARGIDPSPAACAAARANGVEVNCVGVDDAELEPGARGRGRPLARARAFRRSGRGAGADPRLAATRGARWWSRSPTWPRSRPGSAAIDGFIRTSPATAPISPRPAPRALLERTGFEPERVRHLLVEQNPLGMWQTLLNRLTRERDFAFRLLKRDLGPAGPAAAVATWR